MKLKVRRERKEQNNGGSADYKYAIIGSNRTYPILLMFMLFYFLFYCCGDCMNKNITPKFITQN